MKFILLLFLSTLNFVINAQEKKIVGYLPDYRFKVSDRIDYCKLTHLNICFANPDKFGNILIRDTMPKVLDYIRSKNPDLKIFISLAGGALLPEQSETWKRLIDIPQNRPDFIKKIVEFTEKYKFDGVDVDLEWRDVTKGYSPFILELRKALEPKNILLTAALPGTHRYLNITNEALHSFDFINLMAYDERGSWAPHIPGQHSSVKFAEKSIYFWRDSIGIPAEKLTLGLPFYAYNFTDPKKTVSHTIKEIMAFDYQNVMRDSIGHIYYNGIPTLEKKVILSSVGLAGVMIWELGQDTTGEYAMINAVHKQFEKLNLKTTDEYCGFSQEQILAIENEKLSAIESERFKDQVIINSLKKKIAISYVDMKKLKISVTDEKGKEYKIKIKEEENRNVYTIKKLKKGTYTLNISNGKSMFIKKLNLE